MVQRHSARKGLRGVAVALIGCAGALYFFRYQILGGGDLLLGDHGDGMMLLAVCEHWFRVFQGLDAWRSPNWFYPAEHYEFFSQQ